MIKHLKCSSLGQRKRNIKHVFLQVRERGLSYGFLEEGDGCPLREGQREMSRKEIDRKGTRGLESWFSVLPTGDLPLVCVYVTVR